MDEILKTLSPTMRGLFGIAVVLRDTVRGLDEIYNQARKEVGELWKPKKRS